MQNWSLTESKRRSEGTTLVFHLFLRTVGRAAHPVSRCGVCFFASDSQINAFSGRNTSCAVPACSLLHRFTRSHKLAYGDEVDSSFVSCMKNLR